MLESAHPPKPESPIHDQPQPQPSPSPTPLIRSVAIVGVGLIGGSFALAIRKAGFAGEILGVSSEATLREAISLGVIDRPATLEEASAAADLIYLANPIGRILEALPIVATHARPDALVTDAGSTKSVILDAAARCFPPGAFLGGHPMAGKATRGVAAAEAALFRGRTYVLTPLPADTERPIRREFVRILEAIGAKVVSMEAHIHDKVVAITSHLPQLLSTVLATTVLDELPDPQYLAISGRGLADMTRLAASSFDVWSDILNTNQQAIIDALDEYLHALHTLRNQLGTDSLNDLFHRAATLPARLRNLR